MFKLHLYILCDDCAHCLVFLCPLFSVTGWWYSLDFGETCLKVVLSTKNKSTSIIEIKPQPWILECCITVLCLSLSLQ